MDRNTNNEYDEIIIDFKRVHSDKFFIKRRIQAFTSEFQQNAILKYLSL